MEGRTEGVRDRGREGVGEGGREGGRDGGRHKAQCQAWLCT